MGAKTVRAIARLACGSSEFRHEVLFDPGASRSFMSTDVAKRLRDCLFRLPPEDRYRVPTTRRGVSIVVDGRASARVRLPGFEAPSTTFEVSADLPPNTVIIGQHELNAWDAVISVRGIKLTSPKLELWAG